MSALAAEPNIHLLGARPYEQLPSVLRGADAGLIPYALNQLTDSIFPMKVYEYLAAGLPVMATPLPALSGIEAVATATTRGHRGTAGGGLAEDTPERRAERSQAAADPLVGAAPGADRRRDRRSAGRRGDLLVTTHTPALRSGRDVRTYGVARALADERPADGALRALRRGRARRGLRCDTRNRAARGHPFTRPRRACAHTRRLGSSGVPDGLARGVSPELAGSGSPAGRQPRLPASDRRRADRRRRARGPGAQASGHLQRPQPGVGFPPRAPDEDASLRGLRSFERRLLRRSSESWMVSEADMRGARALPEAKLRLAPNVVDVSAIRPVFATPADLTQDRPPVADDTRTGAGFIRARDDPRDRAGGDLRRQLRLRAKPQRA